ncbi:hypothetical protein KYK30_22495 [Shinella yambaruensis]|uniref:Uncharacterized protein n=1 Tax=Shinella yambaruensis TaxID=415996 RepID=A0ABQ5ZG55_9HYPH|nr:hypothetical protein [Shinella yambaruensis]MCJ8029032.1 hypothetical protein [Shinella yambaruensis]MCU7982472.1 hypothetical protein [Shinella yambaruensis]GLR51653.1 hypothetical protein GCM10007923_28620 [Shinella yambaruensis]
MILTVKRQMIILQAYVPIAPITQGRKGKILFCRKGRGALRTDDKTRQARAFLTFRKTGAGIGARGCRLSRIASKGACRQGQAQDPAWHAERDSNCNCMIEHKRKPAVLAWPSRSGQFPSGS